LSSHWLCAVPRTLAGRFARRLPVLLAGLALANGCGFVSSSSFTSSGEGGAVSDGSTSDAVVGLSVDSSSCQPADVETYIPGDYHPATAAWQGVCTGDEIQAFYDACLGPGASPADCKALSAPDAAGAECAACILTPDSASAYGPLIDHGTFITNNVAGCIQLTFTGELSCAKAEAALGGCELAACEANCPVENAATRTAYDSCASAADTAGCQSYEQMASCAQSLAQDDAGAAALCLSPSFEAFYDAVVPLFCGAPPPVDAGIVLVDAGGDATPRPEADAGGLDGGGVDAARESGAD
jgi:hypothetical protein